MVHRMAGSCHGSRCATPSDRREALGQKTLRPLGEWHLTWALLLLGLLSVGATGAESQSMVCISPPAQPEQVCALEKPAITELIVVRLVGKDEKAVAGVVVSFGASAGKIDSSATTNADGEAFARWSGDASNAAVVIDVVSVHSGLRVHRQVRLGGPDPAPLILSKSPDLKRSGDKQHSFAERQLPRKITVLVENTNGEVNCRRARIVFRPLGEGQATPDTSVGLWRDGVCYAETRWRIGKTVGSHSLRAYPVNRPGSAVPFEAKVRGVPWIGMGLALTRVSEFDRLSETKATLRVTRRFVGPSAFDTTEIAYDSTVSMRKPERTAKEWVFTPMIGLNFPVGRPFLGWSRLRLSVSADARDPRSHWFAGFSLPQVFGGVYSESVEIDLHLVTHFARRDVLTNREACLSDIATCNVDKKTRPVGIGVLLELNSATLFKELLAALTK